MKKESKKIGSIYYENTRNRWKCAYYVYDKEKKVEVRKVKTYRTETEAQEFLEQLQYQRNNEMYIKYNGIPLNELMKANVKRKFDTNLIGEGQYARLMRTIKTIEKNELVFKNIDDISSDEIQDYLNTLIHYSNSCIGKIVEQFRQAFRIAMNKGYIKRNPMIDVIKPKSKKVDKEVRAMEIEEQQQLIDYLGCVTLESEPYKNALLIQLFMGLRIGEVLALRSTDVDLKKNILHVRRTLTENMKGEVVMGDTTKTYSGIRDVPIPEFMRDSLVQQLINAENNFEQLLFVDGVNGYVRARNVNRQLHTILKKIGLPPIFSTHSLRHTYGTRCVEAGMRAVALQRLMGHKDVSVTLNTYTSIFNRYKEAEMERVNQYYIDNALLKVKNLSEDNQELIQGKGSMKKLDEEKGK